VALLLVMLGLVLVGGSLAALIGGSLNDFTANLPHYETRLRQQVGDLLAWLEGLGVHLPREIFSEMLDPGKAMRLAGRMLSGLGGMLTNTFLILLTVIFLLLEAAHLPAKLKVVLSTPERSMARLGSIASNINHYMAIKAATSLLTGLGVTLWLWILGVDYPVLWGLMAFLLNFVPSIGSIIAAIPAVLLALVQFGFGIAMWTMIGYLAINILIGSVLEPRVMGRGLGLSTLVVFVSLVFWGWVLGPVGMFLSVPLTMTLKIALDSSPETRPAAVLLGSDVPVPETKQEETT
jgi:predicted PurR-regulated permease PerM